MLGKREKRKFGERWRGISVGMRRGNRQGWGRRSCDRNSRGWGLNFHRKEEDFVTEGNRGIGEGKWKLREKGEGRESGEGHGETG